MGFVALRAKERIISGPDFFRSFPAFTNFARFRLLALRIHFYMELNSTLLSTAN